ncbi:MAG: phage tail tape measure protein [Ruminococcus sp.]|nr:phage tail tape measure protein [Ruminococcus sp.]
MAELKARFSLIDDMSDRIAHIGDSGLNMIEAWERAGEAASSAVDGIASSATHTATIADGVAHSIDDLSYSTGNAGGAADSLTAALSNLDNAMSEASTETDHWTAAAQSYDKSALEMVYTTQELVEMGLKTADALGNVEEMYEMCETAAEQLNSELESSSSAHEALVEAIQSSARVMEEFADNGKISAEASERLEEANKTAANAMSELETAQNEAKAAMEAYDETIISGTTDLDALGAAAERAEQAEANLAAANEKASKATEQLSQASQGAAESAESSGEQGVKAIEAVADTIVAKAIVEKIEEIITVAYELADAFSESQKIIVNATGATGENLEGLEQSMMNAYSNNKRSLDTTAAAIGEINTRMHLQGDALTDVTGKFLDYSTVTGSNVVNSVANVTKVMNKWNVEQEQCESVMDKLVYASQISGASVDNLSSSLINGAGAFQQVDLSLDNTISLLAALELYGLNSSTAIMAMRTAVKHFSDEGEDAGAGLRKVIEEIENLESSAEATALACDVFGSRAGVEMANAIRNGAVSVEMLNGDLSEAQGTLEKTAQAGETLSEKWEKSNNKIKTAFTSALQPTIDKMSSGLAEITGFFGDFLNKHPLFTKALTAAGIGLGVAALAFAGYTASAAAATIATTQFGIALKAATGPIGWIALGATAVAGGVMLIASAFSKGEEEIADYNGTMEECQAELQRTEAAYTKACELYGENSSVAMELSNTLDTLNAQFDKGGGIISVYVEQADKLANSFKEVSTSQQKAIEEIDKSQTSGMTAIAMLSALSEQSSHTNADLDIMAGYADHLNDTFNCDIKVNYSTGELTGFDPQVIVGAVIEAANSERYQNALDYLSGADFQDKYVDARVHVKELGAELEKLQAEQQALNNVTTFTDPSVAANMRSSTDISSDIIDVTNAINEYNSVITTAEAEIESYGEIIDSTGKFTENYKNILDGLVDSQTKHLEQTVSNVQAISEEEQGIQAAATAYQEYQTQIEELCTSYDEVYQAALDSFQGQFSLFEQASTTSETYLNSTVANAQAALDTQLNYWTTYGQNIEVLKNTSAADLGITEENYNALMSYVQSGSEEAAGLAASMVSEIQSGHSEAVTQLANTAAAVSSKQEEIASTTADWVTGFSQQMDEIVSKMNSAIGDLDLSTEANTAATNTIQSYANAITANGGAAVTAAQSIARQVQAALSSASTTINIGVNSTSVPGHATGTTAAEDIFIAGENGPELVVGKAGSTVFPTSETNKIISALRSMEGPQYNRTFYATQTTSNNYNNSTNDYSRAIEYYDQRKDITEINNNSYTTIENGSGYDDGRIITILTGFLEVFSALEKKMNTKSEIEIPELNVYDAYRNGTIASDDTFIAGEKGPELIIGQPDSYVFPTEETDRIIKAIGAYEAVEPYDFTALEKRLNRQSGNITNLDESVKYGDNYSVSNIRNYSNEYSEIANKINSAETEYNNSIDRSYAETVNYGDSIRSFEESINSGDSSYNTVTSYDNERNYTTSTDTAYGDAYDNNVNYGASIRNVAEEISSSNDRSYAATINYGDTVSSFIENVAGAMEEHYNASNSINSSSAESNYSINGGNTIKSSTDYGDSVRNYVDSVSVLSEAIRNNSSANNHYEQALTNLSNEYVDNTNTTEQAAQSIENAVSGDTFNNSERNVERMEQSIANDNRAYEEISTSSDVSKADYYNTANTYGGSEYYDSRRTAEENQSNDSRAFETVTSYGDSVKNFESSYINTENASQTFENRTESVFIPFMGIISAMLERAFSDNLRAVEANYEAVYPAESTAETESTYSISIPKLPELTDNDRRVVAERGIVRQDDSGRETTDGSRSEAGTETAKRIVLEIAGSGSIDISDGVDEEKVLELIEDNIKPVLMNIIQSEIYEEGELSYEY